MSMGGLERTSKHGAHYVSTCLLRILLTITVVQLPLFTSKRVATFDIDSLAASSGSANHLNESTVQERVKGVIVSSKMRFRDSYQSRGMPQYEMPPFSPDKLEYLFGRFLDKLKECSLEEPARITVDGNEYSGIPPSNNQVIVEDSIKPVDYWKGLFEKRKEKFISGGLNGCDTRLRSMWVCHVVLKLALQTEGDSDSIKQYYVVGRLSRDRGHGAFTHTGDFFLVEETALEELDDGTFKLAVEDRRQDLGWTCNAPEAEELELVAEDRLEAATLEGPVETLEKEETLVNVNPTGGVSASTGDVDSDNFRCCCYHDASGVHTVGVKVLDEDEDGQPVAVGHWGLHAGTVKDQACPVIGAADGGAFCACTTTNAGFSWVVKSKCKKEAGKPTHSPKNTHSQHKDTCAEACRTQQYEARITAPCTA